MAERRTHQSNKVEWHTLVHNGPLFAPPYEPLPPDVKLMYSGEPIDLGLDTEEVAGFYARLIDSNNPSTKEKRFSDNFFRDWRKVMTQAKQEKITEFTACDFSQIHSYYEMKRKERLELSREERREQKLESEREAAGHDWCTVDGVECRVTCFRLPQPGLFIGRGMHPKMGCLKHRVTPEDVVINCSRDVAVRPPEGHCWQEVRHDPKVTWLAAWTDNITGLKQYIYFDKTTVRPADTGEKRRRIPHRFEVPGGVEFI